MADKVSKKHCLNSMKSKTNNTSTLHLLSLTCLHAVIHRQAAKEINLLNETNYPVEKSKGSIKKYTEL